MIHQYSYLLIFPFIFAFAILFRLSAESEKQTEPPGKMESVLEHPLDVSHYPVIYSDEIPVRIPLQTEYWNEMINIQGEAQTLNNQNYDQYYYPELIRSFPGAKGMDCQNNESSS